MKLFHAHAAPGALACGATVDTLLGALPSQPVLLLLYRRCLLSTYRLRVYHDQISGLTEIYVPTFCDNDIDTYAAEQVPLAVPGFRD